MDRNSLTLAAWQALLQGHIAKTGSDPSPERAAELARDAMAIADATLPVFFPPTPKLTAKRKLSEVHARKRSAR
jgi:hypothetical protein